MLDGRTDVAEQAEALRVVEGMLIAESRDWGALHQLQREASGVVGLEVRSRSLQQLVQVGIGAEVELVERFEGSLAATTLEQLVSRAAADDMYYI